MIDPLGERYPLGEEIDAVLADLENGKFSPAAKITSAERAYSPQPDKGIRYRLGRYGDAYLPSSEAVDLVSRALQLTSTPRTLLEVGAGVGMWSSLLSQHFHGKISVIATDKYPKAATIWPVKVLQLEAVDAMTAYPGAVILSLFPRGRFLIDVIRTMKAGTLLLHSGPESDYKDELQAASHLLSEIDSAELFKAWYSDGKLVEQWLRLYRRV